MTDLFVVTDPRGFLITCTLQQWKEHVLSYHPDMNETDVQEVLTNPLIICQDVDLNDRQAYYYKKLGARSYLKVIIKLDGTNGFLVTAYRTTSTKKGEKLLWPN